MLICPLCLHVNAQNTAMCQSCGEHRFVGGPLYVTQEVAVPVGAAPVAVPQRNPPSVVTRPSQAHKQAEIMRTPFPTPVPDQANLDLASSLGPASTLPPACELTKPRVRVQLRPKLEVVRGERLGVLFPVLEGKNIIGRTVDRPADIDLTGQERQEQVWTSRQHTQIHFDGRSLVIEDLKSLNGTFVNRVRLHPGQPRVLQPNDIIQVGTVQLRVLVTAEKVEEK